MRVGRDRASRRSVRLHVGFAVAASALVALGGFEATRSSLLDARSVVVTGAAHLTRAEVLATAGLGRHTNVLWLDDATVEAVLERDPWVASADVSRSLPWTIDVRIVERTPVAMTVDGGVRSLIANDGTVLGPATSVRGLPRIELPPAAAAEGARPAAAGAATALGAMSDDLRADVSRVIVASDATLDIRLDDGTLVRYGAPLDEARKAAVLERALAWAEVQPERVGRISVVAPGSPAVVFVP
jgi:cell division protein FtsQ